MQNNPWGQTTKYFIGLTPERILTAIEKVGYRCTGRIFTLYSMENRVYSVEIENPYAQTKWDNYVIVKFYRPGRWTADQILEEHKFTNDLLANDVPVVAPLTDANGKTLGQEADSGLYFALYPRIGGRIPDEISLDDLPIVARLMARLHATGKEVQAQHRIKLDPHTYGLSNLEHLLGANVIPNDLKNEYQALVQELATTTQPWFNATSFQRIHGDCHRANLLWGSTGPFWIDFDDMVVGPPVQDMWLLIHGIESPGLVRDTFLEAYEEFCTFDYQSLRLIEPLRALRYVHFSAWIAKRWEDPTFPDAFPNFGTRSYWQEQIQDLKDQLDKISHSK